MNCRQPADKIRQSDSPLLLNISLTQPGAWKKRRGSKLIGASEAGSGIQGAATYIKSDNTEEIRIIRDGDIEVFDGSSFSVTAAGAFATGSKVISANFKNRVYHISDGATDYLKYETGGSTTDVGSGADRISGQTLAVAQNTLFVVKDIPFTTRYLILRITNLATNCGRTVRARFLRALGFLRGQDM